MLAGIAETMWQIAGFMCSLTLIVILCAVIAGVVRAVIKVRQDREDDY